MLKTIAAALVLTATASAAPVTYGPAEAIALAKVRAAGTSGRFQMTVAATGVTPNGVFLNSTADYRAADNLTFRLSPVVAKMLGKRVGAALPTYLVGHRVVVDGRVQDKPVAHTVGGRARSLERWQHEVEVTLLEQVVSID